MPNNTITVKSAVPNRLFSSEYKHIACPQSRGRTGLKMPTAQVKPCTAVCLVTCAISPAGGRLVRHSGWGGTKVAWHPVPTSQKKPKEGTSPQSHGTQSHYCKGSQRRAPTQQVAWHPHPPLQKKPEEGTGTKSASLRESQWGSP